MDKSLYSSIDSYPGLWEISMIPLKDKNGFICSMFDECGRGFTTEDEVYQFFMDNFNRHFQNSRAPFPLYGHATWMLNGNNIHRRNGKFNVKLTFQKQY